MSRKQGAAAKAPAYRSGAVARLTGIPVETLRVWERRYGIVGPRQSASGQRHYRPDEVARLALIKQLVDLGHAIGSIAALDLKQLRAMLDMATRNALAAPRPAGAAAQDANRQVRVAIVGEALCVRVARRPSPALRVVATGPDPVRAVESLRGARADVLLIELPTLNKETPGAIHALATRLGARQIVVEYGFGPRRIEQALLALGCRLVHGPLDIDQLEALCGEPASPPPTGIEPVAPPRFDRKALAEISMASSAINCECPRHVTDLLVRLGNFETYSAECENRDTADAALHRLIREITGRARTLLEGALTRIAAAEGIPLPLECRDTSQLLEHRRSREA